MAAILKPDAIEVRYHGSYSDADVARIIRSLIDYSALSTMRHASVTFQGRRIRTADDGD